MSARRIQRTNQTSKCVVPRKILKNLTPFHRRQVNEILHLTIFEITNNSILFDIHVLTFFYLRRWVYNTKWRIRVMRCLLTMPSPPRNDLKSKATSSTPSSEPSSRKYTLWIWKNKRKKSTESMLPKRSRQDHSEGKVRSLNGQMPEFSIYFDG